MVLWSTSLLSCYDSLLHPGHVMTYFTSVDDLLNRSYVMTYFTIVMWWLILPLLYDDLLHYCYVMTTGNFTALHIVMTYLTAVVLWWPLTPCGKKIYPCCSIRICEHFCCCCAVKSALLLTMLSRSECIVVLCVQLCTLSLCVLFLYLKLEVFKFCSAI